MDITQEGTPTSRHLTRTTTEIQARMKTEEDTSEMTTPTITIGHRTTTEIAGGGDRQQCKTSKRITIMRIETDMVLSTIKEAGAVIGIRINRIHHEDPS
jgi:hypothetical protein